MNDRDKLENNCDHFMCGIWSDGTCGRCGKPVNVMVIALKQKEYAQRMLDEQQNDEVVQQ